MYVFAALVLCLLGYAQTEIRRDGVNNNDNTAIALNDSRVSVTGIVEEVVDREKGFRFRLSSPLIQLDTLLIDFPSILLFSETNQVISVGMKIATTGDFFQIKDPRNPGEFDFKSFYGRKGIFGRIYTDETDMITIESFEITNIQSIQQWIRNVFKEKIGGPFGLLTALILGDKTSVDPEIREDFTNTGVIHVLAVSGLHVGYVLIILMVIAKLFRLPWGWDRLLIIIGLIFFCFLTGGKPSVIRASLMAGIYMVTPITNREGNLWNTIFLSAFILLLYDPLYIMDLGFLFSYTAVASIIFFYQLIQDILPDRLRVNAIQSKPLQFIYGLFLVSFSAQIGTLPITAYYFGRIPIISLIANIIIVPIIGVLVAIGFCILFFGWIPFLGDWIGESAWFMSKVISWTADIFAQVPFAVIEVNQFTIMGIVMYFIGLIIVFLLFMEKYRRYAIFPGLLMGSLFIWKMALSSQFLNIIYMDVGQGDAIIVKLPNKQTILIDGGQRFGSRDYGELVVKPVLKHFDINRINYLIMTHPHSDHIGGLISVSESFPIDTAFDTYLDYDSWAYKTVMTQLLEDSTVVLQPIPGQVVSLSQDCYLTFFTPDSHFVKRTRNVNNASIVMRLVYGKTSFLFTGDLELEGEAQISQFNEALKSDVLKVGHHGSKTSSSEYFLERVLPKIAVVSVGYKNKFRHPNKDVMNRMSQYADKIHRTDQSGALWLQSDGSKIWEVNWK
ncbi:MAG: DNA internalization-related competence protein ComEC/Rec2 [Candidatus Marinimicrobia bacterium]|nr:DNA internalization-related competence protein ComEC/Rec2 [Candidatus Neomarinimicrobiota bacterium]MBL7029969.1 DNA internalization-related competence protein ComEC/Rec2 [Candidatus Neomarinimicrobiota bacterium]